MINTVILCYQSYFRSTMLAKYSGSKRVGYLQRIIIIIIHMCVCVCTHMLVCVY